jgi:PIN domain nuclease of toxin-antitoxin system
MARLLIDTHVLLWWLDGDKRLVRKPRQLVQSEGNDILVSAATVWEITTKARIGKLPGALAVAADVPACLADQGFMPLSITVEHAQIAGNLPGPHRDPFDRMLIAQAQAERIPIVSIDAAFDSYGVTRIW